MTMSDQWSKHRNYMSITFKLTDQGSSTRYTWALSLCHKVWPCPQTTWGKASESPPWIHNIREQFVFIKPLSCSICPWRQFNLTYPDSYRVFTGTKKIRLDCTREELRGTPDMIKTQFIVGILKIIVYIIFIKKSLKVFRMYLKCTNNVYLWLFIKMVPTISDSFISNTSWTFLLCKKYYFIWNIFVWKLKFVPAFPCICKRDKSTYFIRLLWRRNILTYVKHLGQ